MEYAFKKLDGASIGTSIDGKELNIFPFVDDLVLITDDFCEAFKMLREEPNKWVCQIKKDKCKVMTT